jgi:hypothetical protein
MDKEPLNTQPVDFVVSSSEFQRSRSKTCTIWSKIEAGQTAENKNP